VPVIFFFPHAHTCIQALFTFFFFFLLGPLTMGRWNLLHLILFPSLKKVSRCFAFRGGKFITALTLLPLNSWG
jgi:hypothetical protein